MNGIAKKFAASIVVRISRETPFLGGLLFDYSRPGQKYKWKTLKSKGISASLRGVGRAGPLA